MPLEPEEPRPYRMPDADMLTFARAKLKVFETHTTDFVAFDPVFGGTYATDWKAAIDACYAHPTDELMLDGLRQRSEQVEAATKYASVAVADLRYFASRAFAADGLYRVFHFHEHDQMRKRTAWYPIYLHTQHTMALRYATELQAKGMTPAQIAALATAADQVRTTDLAQELHKRDRTEATVQRAELFRTMYAFLQKLNAAADVVFASDPIKRALFNVG